MELAEGISDEYLTCTICFEPFTDPKQLPCLHTFCKRCLSSHITYNVKRTGHLYFSCPVCRKTIKPANPDPRAIASWADEFPNNFFIISLKDTLESYDVQARPVDRGTTSKEGDEQCPKHDGFAMDAYCTVEKVGVCTECVLEEHSTCQGQHLKTHNAKAKAESSLGDLKRNINTFKDKVTDIKTGLNAKPRVLRLQKEKLTLDISEHFTALKKMVIEQLLLKESETVERLAELMTSEEESNEGLSKECDSLSTSLDRTVKLFEKLLSRGSINALCMLDKIASQVDGYKQAISNLESESEDQIVSFIPVESDLQAMLRKAHIGDIKTKNNTVAVSLGSEEGISAETSSSDSSTACFSEVLDLSVHNVEPSAPPMEAISRPSGLEGFLPESISNVPRHRIRQTHSPSSTYTGQIPQSVVMPVRELQIPTDVPMNFYISHRGSLSANISRDERSGGIVGVSAVLEDHVAVVDRFNKSMKVLHLGRGKIENLVTFGEKEPWDVTYIPDCQQLVVTFPADRNIFFYEAQDLSVGQCERVAVVATRGSYISLAALKTDLIAAGIGQPFGHAGIHIINRGGTVITIVESRMQYPRCMQTTSDGKLVVCDWTNKEVLLIGHSYQLETLYHGTYSNQLKDPMGVACDSRGRVYVLDRKTRAIHVLDGRSGNCIGVVYTDHVPQPRLLVISRQEEVLVVVDFSNRVHSFTITNKQDLSYVTQV